MRRRRVKAGELRQASVLGYETGRFMANDVSPALYFQIFGLKPGRGEKRRLAIVEAFVECLASEGLDKTSFEAIGKRVGMTRTHVAYFFANREELIFTTVRYIIATGQEILLGHLAKATTPDECLRAVIEGPFLWMEKHPHHSAVMGQFYYLCTYEKKFRDLQAMIQKGGEERLRACLSQMTDLSPAAARSLARSIQALSAGTLNYYFSCDYGVPLPKLRADTVRAAMDWVNYLRSSAKS